MSTNYWFGVAGGISLHNANLKETWWCLPYGAQEGDRILLYCPRAESERRQGVFAEAKVLTPPNKIRRENSYCASYGKGTSLGYAEIMIVERFTPALTARHMKSDSVLCRVRPVRHNFQGTTFALDVKSYQRMKLQLNDLANTVPMSNRKK